MLIGGPCPHGQPIGACQHCNAQAMKREAPRPLRTHRLKTWPGPFAALLEGTKTFELRRDDRGYAVGDVLDLIEWDPAACGGIGMETGRGLRRVVTYRCSVIEWSGESRGWVVLGLGAP